jgi:O-antigen ligase
MNMKVKVNAHAFGALLFSLSWLLTDHYRPWTSFHSEALAFLAVCFLFASFLLAQSREILIPRITGWIVFTGALIWLQHAIGTIFFAGDALLSFFYLSGFLFAIVVGSGLMQGGLVGSSRNWLGLVHAVWFAALISAAIGLAQWLNVQDRFGIYAWQTDPGTRAAGNLGQSNQLATFLLMGIASLVTAHEKRVINKAVLVLAVTFLTFVLVLTQSRAGMVSACIVGAFLLWKQNSVVLRLPKSAVWWWLACFMATTLSLPSLSQFLMLGDVRSLTATESVSERWLIWKQVSYAIAQAPWFGYGWNQTPTANAVGALVFPGATSYTNAHNIVLDLMAWCGIPFGLLLTVVMAYWLISRLKALNRPDAVFAMASLLPIAVHSMLEFPFAYAYFLIAAGFMVGIVEAGHAPTQTFKLGVAWLWGFLAIWTALGSYMTHEYFLIEEDFRIVRFENLRVGATPTSYEVPHVWMLSHMAAMLKAARQVPMPEMPKADQENLRKVSDRFAYGAIRFKYAQALGLNSDPVGASKQMQIIHGMYGDFYYGACKDELLRLAAEKYPQLAQVKTP